MTILPPDSMSEKDALTCKAPITQIIARASVSPIYSCIDSANHLSSKPKG